MTAPKRGDVWTLAPGVQARVLIVSSTVYNEIETEPTIIGVPVLAGEPDTGFGVVLGEGHWAATGLVTSLRKSRLTEFERNVGTQALTDVNNMLFRILATPER